MGIQYVQARIVPVLHLQVKRDNHPGYKPTEGLVSSEVLEEIYEQLAGGKFCATSLAGSSTQYAVLCVNDEMVTTQNGTPVVSVEALSADLDKS